MKTRCAVVAAALIMFTAGSAHAVEIEALISTAVKARSTTSLPRSSAPAAIP